MGDCRIRVLIARELLPDQSSSTDGEWHAITYTDSADATVRDVYEVVLEPLFGQPSSTDHACLWDCTLHPPKDISEWLSSYNEKTGPKSKTLYDAGWYPSGTWQVLPRGQQPIRSQNYDDVQYNLPSALISTSAVRLVDNETMTPSQVLQSVTTRFPKEEDTGKAFEIRRERRHEKAVKEAERHAKLEKRIGQLNSSDKPVATQVRRMLIKSRCTGSSSLKMHDRVYLHLVVVNEETLEDYRYFSQQDTVARVIAIPQVKLPQVAELLVRYNHGYRRLPITMRLYEAIAGKYLEQVDSVVIRCFTPPDEEPTTSVVEKEQLECDAEIQVNVDPVATNHDESASSIKGLEASSRTVMNDDANNADTDISNQMTNAIAAMDEATSSKRKKKTSSTSHKVRTMLIKSKAKGDAKRVPKMDNRFFLELVVIRFFEGECVASASLVFLSKMDPVKRLLRDCVSVPSGFEATVLVPTEQGGFRQVPDDISLQDAETKGFFKSFDRAVVRLYKP